MKPASPTFGIHPLLLSLAAYALLLPVFLLLARLIGVQTPWQTIALALFPVVLVVWGLWAVLRLIAGTDELERKIQVEGLVFAVVPITLLTFAYGFLEEFAGFPRVPMFAVWAMLAVSRGVGLVIANRRYR